MNETYKLLAWLVWGPFLLTFILSFLPDPLIVFNIAPDFGLEEFIIIPNFYRQLWIGLNPFWFGYLIFVTMVLLGYGDKKK